MAKSTQKDEFAQIAYIGVNESAANTLTFNGLSVFSNVLTPKGLLVHAVEYHILPATIDLLAADTDGIRLGLAGTDQITAIEWDDARVYDFNSYVVNFYGTPASQWIFEMPIRVDWSGLPGGGRLLPADRIYGFVQGIALGGAASIEIRFHFTLIDLSAQQYIELAQSLRVLT